MANAQLNELVDYIKKAKQAGQSDEQTRQILFKNGWSDVEVKEAFAVISVSKPQQQVQRPQQTQPQSQPQPQYQLVENKKFRRGGGRHFVLKLLIALIILAVIGAAGYFIIAQTGLLQKMFNVSFSTEESSSLIVENSKKNEEPPPSLNLATVKLATILQDYDISKGIVAALFSKAADKVAYCAPQKTVKKTDCFLNSEKLSNSYSYNPYWIGISPDGNRVVFLYFDSVKKQSFVFENGEEGARYDGTITSPNFSHDSQSFIYTVMGKDNKNFVVLNGKPGALHEKIYGAPSLSSDGRYLLYGARDGQDIFWVADEVK